MTNVFHYFLVEFYSNILTESTYVNSEIVLIIGAYYNAILVLTERKYNDI